MDGREQRHAQKRGLESEHAARKAGSLCAFLWIKHDFGCAVGASEQDLVDT